MRKYIKEYLNINENKFSSLLIVGQKYEITEPNYDDYDEVLEPETDIVEVISKNVRGVILKNIKHNFTYQRTYQHLMNCQIRKVNK